MIVNTVVPDAVAPVPADNLANDFNSVSSVPSVVESSLPAPEEVTTEAQSDTEKREEHSADVELTLHVNDGPVVQLAQVGPDFAILPPKHEVIITASTRGMLYVSIDGKCDPVEVELTTDVDFSTERFGYRRIATPVVTDTTSVVQVDPAAADKAANEMRFWEEVKLLGQLVESEQDRAEIESTLKDAIARQKTLQSELNDLAIKIPQVEGELEEACEQTLRIARSICQLKAGTAPVERPSQAALETNAQQSQPTDGLESHPTEQPAESTEWRNLATSELLAGIKGLGKKKLEAICDLAPTVGHLEDLRGQASREHKQYNEVLPDGCGAGVAQMIEDRLVTHIANCAKRSVVGNPLADELLAAFRHKAAAEKWRVTDCEPDSNDTGMTHAGFAAYNESKSHTALPTLNPELARQWMLGWVCAEVIKHAPVVERPSQAARDPEDDTSTDVSVASEGQPTEPAKPKKPRKRHATKKK